MTPQITFIIVNWNRWDLVAKQLPILTHFKSGQVIVVDNFSDTDLPQHLKTKFDQVIWLLNKQNLGFARACNLGAQKAQSEWLFFLNPDVMFDRDEQILALLRYAQANQLDAVSPQPEKNQVDLYAKNLPTVYNLVQEFTPLGRFLPQQNGVKSLTGGLLLIKKSVLQKIGGWDGDFFVWFEDCDLTYRLLEGGYKVGWSPEVIHHIGAGSVLKLEMKERKRLYFGSMQKYADKHFGWLGQLAVKIISLINT